MCRLLTGFESMLNRRVFMHSQLIFTTEKRPHMCAQCAVFSFQFFIQADQEFAGKDSCHASDKMQVPCNQSVCLQELQKGHVT